MAKQRTIKQETDSYVKYRNAVVKAYNRTYNPEVFKKAELKAWQAFVKYNNNSFQKKWARVVMV